MMSNGNETDRRQQVGLDEAQPVGDPVADRVLAGELERLGRDVGRDDLDVAERLALAQRGRERDGDRATARADIGDPDGLRADRPRSQGETIHHLAFGELDDELGLRPRDEARGIGREGQPVELLEPRM